MIFLLILNAEHLRSTNFSTPITTIQTNFLNLRNHPSIRYMLEVPRHQIVHPRYCRYGYVHRIIPKWSRDGLLFNEPTCKFCRFWSQCRIWDVGDCRESPTRGISIAIGDFTADNGGNKQLKSFLCIFPPLASRHLAPDQSKVIRRQRRRIADHGRFNINLFLFHVLPFRSLCSAARLSVRLRAWSF